MINAENECNEVKNEYGFDWPPNFKLEAHIRYIHKYQATSEKQLEVWKRLNGNYTKNEKLKQLVRQGIPRQYRCNVWMDVSGAKTKMKNNPGLFDELIGKSGKTYESVKDTNGEYHLDIIKRDLPRTFPENSKFSDGVMRNNLQDILLAFALYKPDIGYCQGLNFIAGSLLLALQQEDGELRAEECFWLIVALVEIIPDYYSSRMVSLSNDIEVLQKLLQKRIPKTMTHLRGFQIPLQAFLTKWFVCLYVDILPIHTVFRIWDCLFYEGHKVLFRVAMFMFINHKHEIKAISDIAGLSEFFKSLFWDQKAWDDYKFVRNIFRRTGKLARDSLQQKREKRN